MKRRPAEAGRVVLWTVLGSLIAYQLVKAVIWLGDPNTAAIIGGTDHALYVNQAHRILAGGPFYQPFQLAGPYGMDAMPELYPPVTVMGLFVPMSLVPDVLWWAIPLTVTGWIVWSWHPTGWAWAAILACLTYPNTEYSILAGNPVIWVTMFVALGTRYRWPAVFALAKPTLAPFALIGWRSRWWWAGLAVMVIGTLLLLGPSLDYITALRNYRTTDTLYLVAHVPMVLIPLIAWKGQPSRSSTSALSARMTSWRT